MGIRMVSNPKPYRSVKIASLTNRRRGKHHHLVGEIMRQLKLLSAALALEIPLAELEGVELENLRSAVHRAAAGDKISVRTQSDEKNFYVWVTHDPT